MYNLKDFHATRFYELKSQKNLEEKYYQVFEIEKRIVDELWEQVEGQEKFFLQDLVHEGRVFASRAINTIHNMEHYKASKAPHVWESLKKDMYHHLLLFSIYMQSLIVFYNCWKEKK